MSPDCQMPTIRIRVYEELSDFLPEGNRKRTFTLTVPEGTTVSQLLGDLGIPSSAVDLVLVDDESVGLSHQIRDGARVSLYPVFERFDIAGVTRLRSQPLRSPSFLTDRSLERLATYLRLLGFDTDVGEGRIDRERLKRAGAEQRILLTREKYGGQEVISRVLHLYQENPRAQLQEVLSGLDLYRVLARNSWRVTPDQAIGIQQLLRNEVVPYDEIGPVKYVGGVDVAFEEGDTLACAAAVVLSLPKFELCDSATARLPLTFPYIPGFLSFRETPSILQAIAGLRQVPDLLFCDGHGYAHLRRFGLACHIGVLTGIPSIGVGKSILTGIHADLPAERGAWVPLMDGDDRIGAAVRTRTGVKPVYVSVGNRISLETAIDYVLRCSRYRLPEPSRRADQLSKGTKATTS